VSHETESPVPPGGPPHADGEEPLPFKRALTERPPGSTRLPGAHAHVMTSGALGDRALPRPQTMAGIGIDGVPQSLRDVDVPAPPLTEVAPAPAVKRALPSQPKPAAALGSAPTGDAREGGDGTAHALSYPRPRPSETMVGSRAPLHTAEDANTQVDLGSLSPDDAERILAAAEADSHAQARRAPTLLTPASVLPPPPPLRRSGFPPPIGASAAGSTGEVTDVTKQMVRKAPSRPPPPVPGPDSARPERAAPAPRSSYPPPPPRRGNTLLLYGGEGARGEPAKPAVLAPPPSFRSPSVRPLPPPRPPADSVEELNAGLLVDDSSELPALNAMGGPIGVQPISSTSLIEDPPSDPELANPELELDEAPEPFAAFPPASFGAPPAPPAQSGHASQAVPRPPPAFGSGFQQASFPLVDVPGPEFQAVEPARAVFDASSIPLDPSTGVPTEPMRSPDPFARTTDSRTTEPPRAQLPNVSFAAAPPAARPSWVLPVVAIGGAVTLALAVGVVAFAIKWTHTKLADGQPSPASSSSAVAASDAPSESTKPNGAWTTAAPGASSSAKPSSAGIGPAPAISGVGAPCVLAGAPHIVAPRALLRTGIEVASGADRIALGVGLGERDGFVVALDPSTFAAVSTARAHATDPLRRVVPILGPASELTSYLETNKRRIELEAAHPVDADPPFYVGVSHGKLAWAPARGVTPTALWPLDGDAAVDAIRAVALPDREGYAVVFRQATSVYLGALHANKAVNGDLIRIGGLGPQVGAPTIAAGADHVLVAWADRRAPSAPWAIRWVKWHPGVEPPAPTSFPVPAGGGGGQVMSPSLVALSGGRFVMAWTEGAGVRHEVRAQALDSADEPVGTALTVSAQGVNAGQGMPALTPDGRGAVVFLATPTGATASVVAVPIICPGGT
jgi:hypothetical protein